MYMCWYCFCHILLTQCLSLQLHVTEALAIYELFCSGAYFGKTFPTTFWDESDVRKLVYQSLTSREWMHNHCRLVPWYDLEALIRFVYPNYEPKPVLLRKDDAIPANNAHAGQTTEVEWTPVFLSGPMGLAWLSVYMPCRLTEPTPQNPGPRLVYPLFPKETCIHSLIYEQLVSMTGSWSATMKNWANSQYTPDSSVTWYLMDFP